MATEITAVYEGGVLKPKERLDIEEHSEVRLLLVRPTRRKPRDPDDPTGWKTINRLIGAGKGPSDLARNHDKYIYDKDE